VAFILCTLVVLTQVPSLLEDRSVVYNSCRPRQHSHSCVRVPPGSLPHFTVSDSRLSQSEGIGPRINIMQEYADSVTPQGTGPLFRDLSRLARLRWRYSNPPPRSGDSKLEFFLRPTVSRPVSLGIGSLFRILHQILSYASSFVWQLRYSAFNASSLTRKRVCSLQCNRSLVRSLTPNNYTLLSHLRLCSLFIASYDSQGLLWKYSNPPRHDWYHGCLNVANDGNHLRELRNSVFIIPRF
jgi:hypothetical protein